MTSKTVVKKCPNGPAGQVNSAGVGSVPRVEHLAAVQVLNERKAANVRSGRYERC